jgi:hypothetical protein
MKKFITTVVVLLAAFAIQAQEIVPATTVQEAQKQAEIKCVKGCLVLSPAEIAAIEQGIKEAMQDAFLKGRKYERSST